MKFLYPLLAFLLAATPAFATIIPSVPYNLTNGSLADATQVMGNFNTIVADVNANAANSGANTNITSLTALTTPLAPSLGGTVVYTGGTTGGSANAQTLTTVVPSAFSLTAGSIVTGIAGATNSGATTLSVAGTTVTAMRVKNSGGLSALVGNEIISGSSYLWYFDGTFWILMNPSVIAVTNIPNAIITGAKLANNTVTGTQLISSIALPGSPTTTTQAASDNSTKIATTAYVDSATVFASQAQMEAASSTTSSVSPGRTQYHPGVAKEWVVFDGTGANPITPMASYNVSGTVTKNGTGDYSVTNSTNFSSGNIACMLTSTHNASDNVDVAYIDESNLPTSSVVRIKIKNTSGTARDLNYVSMVCFGDQ